MPTRTSKAEWKGNLEHGKGTVKLGSGAFEGAYSFSSRFEEGKGTNPEELIGAAHAGCFSMALSADLAKAGFTPKSVRTSAQVELAKDGGGVKIASITLHTQAEVPDIDAAKFATMAEATKKSCPVSKALSAVPMTLHAELKK